MKRPLLSLLLCALLAFSAFAPGRAEPLSGVIYEIFVRAFADSNGDGIGDLRGLSGKLDYLKDLGVSALWLMPVHPSPSHHGYDVTDYLSIHPDYGTLADFTELLDAAHARGIRVLLDIPFNHTSSRHPWFLESLRRDSPYRAWYRWADPGTPGVDLNQMVWGQKPWRFLGGSFYYALFWEGMPDLNLDHPPLRREIARIARFWLDLGVDGFRLDAVSHYYAEGETGRLQDIAASAAFLEELARDLRRDYPDVFLLGEAWEAPEKRAAFLGGLDAVVNFYVGDGLLPLLKRGGSGAAFLRGLEGVYQSLAAVNPDFVDAPFLSNHDQVRAAAALGLDLKKEALAARVLLTLPGIPILYYGEEIGMSGAKPDEELRTPFLWGGEDPAQTSWHPSRYNKKTVPLAEQREDPDSLYQVYRRFLRLRRENPALGGGRFRIHPSTNPIPLAFTLEAPGQQLLVLHNPSGKEQRLKVPEATVLYAEEGCHIEEGTAVLAGLSSLILELPPGGTP